MVTINSTPDLQGNVTQLEIDSAGTTMQIRAVRSGVAHPILTANLSSLFSIEFSRHSLKPPPPPHPQNIPNWAYWGVYRYSAATPTRVEQVSGGVRLVYEQVGYVHDVTGRDPNAPLPAYVPDLPNEQPGKIQVIATITPAVLPQNAGLINFDIEHTYPSQFLSNNTTTAWESRVIYPRLRFKNADVGGFETYGNSIQCAALFKVEQAINAFYFMRGISVYTDDDNGHFKEVRYEYEPEAVVNAFNFHVVNPIHLKDTAGSKAYVRPDNFKLTGGDEFGFGGNVMVYRLRAFHVSGVYDFAPVGIYDVLRQYREWVKGRRPAFYRKHITTRVPGAIDQMAPFATITNYGPDGPIDPSVSDPRFQKDLGRWLEQHPAKHGEPDMPGNQQPSLLNLLSRLRSKFNAWSLWENLSQDSFRIASSPAVCSWGPNRLDVFARGTDNALYHKSWNGQWSAWQNLGGALTSAPCAVSWGPNRIDVFVRGAGNALYHKFWNGAWSGWANLGGVLTSAPAVASWGPNRLDVFVRGTDNAVYHKSGNGSQWSAWNQMPGGLALAAAPSAVSWGPNRIDLFVQGTDAALYIKSGNGTTWSDWIKLGTPSPTVKLALAPAAVSWEEQHLEVYVRGTDNRLWRKPRSVGFDGEWEGGWDPWESTGPFTFKDDPTAVCWAPNRTDVFVRGTDDTLQHRWSDAYARLEAQIWCQSMAPMYRFYGSTRSASSTISRDDTKFRRSMDELTANGIDSMITTDPFNPIIDRKRFSLHVVKNAAGQWEDAIPHPFPTAYQGKTCAVTDVTIDGKRFKRVFLVRPNSTPRPATPQPSCADVQTAFQSERRDRFGRLTSGVPAALGTGLYKSTGAQLCPTKSIEDIYLDGWLRDRLFADNVRLIEFMKHGFRNQACYDKNHQHGEPPISNSNYNAVIGVGSWITKRYKTIFERVQNLGFTENSSFWLTTEFQPTEQLLPYFDEVYTSDELFHFVYSNFVSPKMHLFRDWAIHPGYREKIPKFDRVPPVYMLDPKRDDDPIPAEADRKASFNLWRGKCEEYATLAGLTVARYGIAPKDYPTGTAEPDDPSTYTYRRFVQDIFNLRATIFDLGQATLNGRRVCVPAILIEEPADYNAELVNTSVRASHFQMAFKDYFRQGFMLGYTAIISGQKTLWAWGYGSRVSRPFYDVAPLVLNVSKDDDWLGAEWRSGSGGKHSDFFSRPVDRLNYYEVNAQGNLVKDAQGNYVIRHHNEITQRPKLSHMIWQLGEGDTRSVFYAFANVGNQDAQVVFLYGLGLEGTFESSPRQTLTTYVTGAGTYHESGTAWLGKQGTIVIPPRSFAGVEITKLGSPLKYRTPAG